MRLDLVRFALLPDASLGILYAGGAPCWFTLEDPDRLAASLPKIPGRTAIPTGTYEVRRKTWSPRFKRSLPEIVGVDGFTHILIHAGNDPADTAGCVLVGKTAKITPQPWIGYSGQALDEVCDTIFAAIRREESVRLTVERSPACLFRIDWLRTFWTAEQIREASA